MEPVPPTEDRDRPPPPGGEAARWRALPAEWVVWFGPARLVVSAAAVLVVCGGVFWLVRSSPPPTEAGLPMATTVAPATPTTTDVDGGAAAGPVSVHVAGAVERAGVYELEAGSRVQAAISAAGGATADADPNALNLAAELVDGTRVYVPLVGEDVPVDAGALDVEGHVARPVGPVDINRASEPELDALPGVGPATAAAIVADREVNGPFLNVEDLTRVRGIGPAKLEALIGLVTT